MGGATACVGDPSGKSELRTMLSKETINENIEKIKNTLKVFLKFDGENPAIIVNNADWFKGYDYVDFMREIGVHFNVNKMLSNEIYSSRIEEGGLTFFEMGYMLMQAYDFVYLNKTKNCELQWGGADQWGNIVAGVELGRKLNFVNGIKNTFIGATNPLLLTPEGKKMGKTERGAIWIDKEKISAYDFYQGVYQTPDACVEMMFALFTDIPMEEVRKLIRTDIVNAKKVLSFEVTKFIRGEEDAKIAQEASTALFNGIGDLGNAPTYEIKKKDFENGVLIIDVAVNSKVISSKSEGRRLIEQSGLMLNDVKVSSFEQKLTKEDFKDGFALLRKGKKLFIKLVIK
jgi:tyrosyl-tRNA synthetase